MTIMLSTHFSRDHQLFYHDTICKEKTGNTFVKNRYPTSSSHIHKPHQLKSCMFVKPCWGYIVFVAEIVCLLP